MSHSRSKWKGPLVHYNLNKINNKVYSRSSIITPSLVGYKFLIHNGKNFINITVSEKMVGHKFGEFSKTRKKFSFKK